MLAQLVSLGDGPSILLDKPILLIGRDPECDIQIDSRKISRRHCCIAQVNDYLVVRDLGSTNGIRINDLRVQEGALKAGDQLMIGGNLYRVSWDPTFEPAEQNANAVRHLEPAGDQPFAANEDLLLESCDEPVALSEGSRPVPLKSLQAGAGVKREEPDSHGDGKTPKEIVHPESLKRLGQGERPEPPILPDSILLAPASDAEVNLSKLSKHSP
jgi:pSer/pThr/pTyr-binding forkhead associated (FHA) protein